MLRQRAAIAGLVAIASLLGGCFLPGGGGGGFPFPTTTTTLAPPHLALTAAQNGNTLCGISSGICGTKFDVTVKNDGGLPTTVNPTVTGTAPNTFTVLSTTCSSVLAANATCTASVSVSSATRPVSGTVTATAGSATASITLTES